MFLLQQDDIWFTEPSSNDLVTVLVVIFVAALALLLFRAISGATGRSPISGTKGASANSPRKFGFLTMYRISSAYGLDRDQSRLLEFVFRNDGVTDPERVMRNTALLDRHFRRAYKTIERRSESEDDAQQRFLRLFSLRNLIEAAPDPSGPATPSRISENTPAVLVNDRENYPVKVLSSRGQNIVVELPRNAIGSPVRLSKGAKVTLSFFTRSTKGFSYDGVVIGAVETMTGPGIQIQHNGRLKRLVKRMYRRRQSSIRCVFYLVFIDEVASKRKSAPKLIVDNKKFAGIIQDISVGGCSIKISAPISVGSRLKISIDTNDNNLISVLGQVLRANRSGPAGAIIHIKFLKVPRRAFNSVNAMVYGYDDE